MEYERFHDENDGEDVWTEIPLMPLSEHEPRLEDLLGELAETDYKCLKWCEGELTDEEYESTKQRRRELRVMIEQVRGY